LWPCKIKSHDICSTHGDATSSNILVRGDKIAALIDFEMYGFYPEYWGYTNAMNANRFDGFWTEEVGKFLQASPRELEMEELRRKHFGPRVSEGTKNGHISVLLLDSLYLLRPRRENRVRCLQTSHEYGSLQLSFSLMRSTPDLRQIRNMEMRPPESYQARIKVPRKSLVV
jgi:hypothetical protein